MEEIWKEIKDTKGNYSISNLGNVKSNDRYIKYPDGVLRFYKERLLSPVIKKTGYAVVMITGRKQSAVHRLVAQHFIPNHENKPFINHINGIKADNRVINLEWCTAKENNQHAYDTGLKTVGDKHKNICAELGRNKAKKVICVLTNRVFNRVQDASEYIGVKKGTLTSMLNGRLKNKTNLKYMDNGK